MPGYCIKNRMRLAVAMVVAMIAASSAPTFANTRVSQARPVADGAVSPLAQMRISCPVLGAIVEEFALQDLGESARRETGHLLVAAGPFAGDFASVARRAREARAAGATMRDFEEALYLTAVTVGVTRAVAVTQVLLAIFAERDSACPCLPVRAGVPF